MKPIKLALFFTSGMSLRGWQQSGLLHRDSLLYHNLAELGHEISFVTYGGPDDRDYLPADSAIRVLSRPKDMGLREYSWNISGIHGAVLSEVDIIKAHQVEGARFAAWAKLRLGKAYIARCGYLPSYFKSQEGASLNERTRIAAEEALSFHLADAVCVPSQSEINYLHRHYRIRRGKMLACPNWVDTEFFSPGTPQENNTRRICFVGRFHPQKDPLLLLEAMRGLENVELTMIGGGPLKSAMEAKIVEYKLNVTLLDRLPNEDLPDYLRSAALYCLPTRYEGGSPKTLFEAMACGLPVVSTDGFGVDDAFEDGIQGIKIRVGDVNGLRSALQKLLDDSELRAKMGKKARQHIIDHYAIDKALSREIDVLRRVQKRSS
jgi:glycosyltransferase involved in cell wall biosynthesis